MKNRNNKGQFVKGSKPFNTGKRMKLNLELINKLHWENGESILDISKKLNVSDRIIRIRLIENGFKIRKKTEPSELVKDKIKQTCIQKGIQPIQRFNGKVWNKGLTQEDERVKKNIQGLLKNRITQVMPIRDTSIEVKIKSFLDQLKIIYEQHKVIQIKHFYQCDFFIPIQEGINKPIVLECDGCYWHGCKCLNKELTKHQKKQICKDNKRTKEVKGKNFRVMRLWEHDIIPMTLEEFKSKLNDNK